MLKQRRGGGGGGAASTKREAHEGSCSRPDSQTLT